MNGPEMIFGIVLVVTIGRVLQARFGGQRRRNRDEDTRSEAPSYRSDRDAARMQEEMRALKERIQVLERVITDNNSSLRLDAEIEKLRDANR